MSTDYVDRSNDEEIIDIVRSVLDNGTGKAETAYEHILIKLMQIRGTPITSFEFDQERADFHYARWVADSSAQAPTPDTTSPTECSDPAGHKALVAALNDMWMESMGNCCTLPCTDSECRDDCAGEGGCDGAEFADKLSSALPAGRT